MEKFNNFFFFILLFASANAANLTCTYNTTVQYCMYFTITPVTQVNENIILTNPPFPSYVDNLKPEIFINDNMGKNMMEFPRNLFSIFTNTLLFTAWNLSTTELGIDSFYNCENLTRINFYNSNLNHFGPGFARSCGKVTYFYAYNSHINSFDPNAFDGLASLQRLEMNYCGIKSIFPALLQPVKSTLNELILDGNLITALHSQQFVGLPMLKAASFDMNFITYIPNFNFTGTTMLPVGGQLQLLLFNCPIKAISPQLVPALIARRASGINNIYVYFESYSKNVINCVNASAPFANNLIYIIGHNDLTYQDTTFRNLTTCYSDWTTEMESDVLAGGGTTTTASYTGGTVFCAFQNFYTPPACPSFNITPITSANESVIINGQPSTYRDIYTLELNFYNQIINFIPSNMFIYFPSMRNFYAENASITYMVTDAFINCNNLFQIILRGNIFTELPAGFARSCTALKELFFSNNNIQYLHPDALQGLVNLRSFDLNYNKLFCVPPTLFLSTPIIDAISLGYNQIGGLDENLFAGLTKVYYINLKNNSITNIPNLNLNSTGTDISSGLTIDLNANPIYAVNPLLSLSVTTRISTSSLVINFDNAIPGTCIPSAVTLIKPITVSINSSMALCHGSWNPPYPLYPDYCVPIITTTTTSTTLSTTSTSETIIPPTIPQIQCATDKICRYYLDWNNQYTCVIDGAEGTVTSISGTHYLSFTDTDLTRLYFTNSHLSKVPNVLFQKFPNLKYLHVRNTGLSVINDQTFNECGNLEFLDVSDNEIFRVEETALKNCTKLKIIDLTGNEIDHVSVGLYQNDPALQRVHLRRLEDWILA